MQRDDILLGDALATLRTLPSECVQTVVTSPPYYGLRDYGVEGQIGLEATPEEYIVALVAVFHEAMRVLRKDGTLWVNLGDSYANDTKWGGGTRPVKNTSSAAGRYHGQRDKRHTGYPPKSLMLIPHRFAIAMQADGWILRQDIIWHKTNAMPESVKDRPTRSHEYIFMMTKQTRYRFNADALREPHSRDWRDDGGSLQRPADPNADQATKMIAALNHHGAPMQLNPQGRNIRTVWDIPTMPYANAHFATFPPELPRRCILAGSRPGDLVLDPFAGAGTTLMVAKRLGRDYLGIELNPQYREMALERIARDVLPPAQKKTDLSLLHPLFEMDA